MKLPVSVGSRASFVCALVALIGAMATVSAHADAIVVPSAIEGNTSVVGPLDSGAYTLQWVYSSTLLTNIPVGAQITGIQYRRNGGGTSNTNATTFADYEIYLSTSTAAPGSLSTSFAANEGADRVQVRDGALTVAAGAYSGGSTPNNWAPVISFGNSYTYTGGDLLITVRHSASTGSSLANADGVSGTSTVDYVSTAGDQNAATGTHLTGVGVTAQLTFAVVPEANTAVLAALGLPLFGAFIAARRRK